MSPCFTVFYRRASLNHQSLFERLVELNTFKVRILCVIFWRLKRRPTVEKLLAGLDHCGAKSAKPSRLSRESQVDFLHGGASSDASDVVTCSWKKAAAAAHPLPRRHPAPLSPPRLKADENCLLRGCRAPPEEVLFLCLPPSPLSTSVREGGGRSALGDQQASAGRSRGRRLSELCSLSPSWQAHSAPVRAAGSCGRLPAGGRTAGEDNSPVTPCRRRRMLQHPHPS